MLTVHVRARWATSQSAWRLDHAERIEPVGVLRSVGFRSRSFVGEYGELLAAAAYPSSRRAPPSQASYDLVVEDLGLVQVKTLRSTPAITERAWV